MPSDSAPVMDFWQMRPFSPLHGVVVAALAALIAALVWAARRKPTPVRVGVGVVALGVWILNQAHWTLQAAASGDWSNGLPLQVCDVVGLVAPLALLTRSRWLMAAAWFGGWGLSVQTIITPLLEAGPGELEFWLFWGMHGGIFASASILVGALGYRPDAGDFARAFAASLGYVLVIVPLDMATGWNYGYMGNAAPDAPTMIDFLGPWPWRIGVMAAIATACYGLLWLPFGLARRWRARQAPPVGEKN